MPTVSLAALLFASAAPTTDSHSFANPNHVVVRHVALDLDVSFEIKTLRGTATLTVSRTSEDETQPLVLDSRGLLIERVETSVDGEKFTRVVHVLGQDDPIRGSSLTIPLAAKAKLVRIAYATGPRATALQWLTPEQTTGKKHPLLFTQSQAIDARTWVPLQDTPAVRITYSAHIRTPKNLLAVMSANNDPEQQRTGDYTFEMKQPIPSYLMALAVGDLAFRKLGPRTGVYAEPAVVGKAAAEFSDVEDMILACEKIFGPYRWDRYDVVVMPPSFPFGGMENPRLTFFSPTVLAGDKSLVAVLAHELAHSWSGNLVSNATWSDFWLNEGFTVYLERRIMEAVYGKARAEVEAVLGKRGLLREMAELPTPDTVLHIDLTGRRPDDGLTDVPYEKGALFLTHLEAVYGRPTVDAFLKGYFAHFSFRSITTAEFEAYLTEHLLKADAAKAKRAKVNEWLYQPGLPSDAPSPSAAALDAVTKVAGEYIAGKTKATELPATKWTTQEWLHFLDALPKDFGSRRMAELDAAVALSKSGNSEVVFQWLLLAIKHNYEPAYPRLERFLTEQGRRKFLKPLYEELVKTPAGKARAAAIYKIARPTYHPLSADTIDAILGTESPITHTLLATGGTTYIRAGDGTITWTYPHASRDGWVLPNGNVLLALAKSKTFPGGGVVEVTKEGKVAFEFKGTQAEVNTVQPLENGNVLLTEAGDKPQLLEVTREGKIAVTVPLDAQTKNHHLQTRMARKLANGNYLVPQLLDKVVREYTPAGKVVWEVKTPDMPFTAIRLDDGHTLIGCTLGHLVIEVDSAGKTVWQLTNDDLPGKPINDACGVQRLPNGNTVVTSHHAGANDVKLTEVTREKKIVWQHTDAKAPGIHHFQILDTNGTPLAGRPLR